MLCVHFNTNSLIDLNFFNIMNIINIVCVIIIMFNVALSVKLIFISVQ